MGKVLNDTLLGAVGGALGTALIRQGQRASGRLPAALQPPVLIEDPGDHILWRAEMRTRRPLSPRTHAWVARGLHWGYGLLWPTLLGLFLPRRRRAKTLFALGAAVGAGVWALGYLGWLPKTHLLEPRMKKDVGRQANAFVSHVLYGVTSALPLLARRA